jgi:hypothetical protein
MNLTVCETVLGAHICNRSYSAWGKWFADSILRKKKNNHKKESWWSGSGVKIKRKTTPSQASFTSLQGRRCSHPHPRIRLSISGAGVAPNRALLNMCKTLSSTPRAKQNKSEHLRLMEHEGCQEAEPSQEGSAGNAPLRQWQPVAKSPFYSLCL